MDEKIIIPRFKNTLIKFLRESMNSCESFISDVEECKTFGNLKTLMNDNGDSIAEHLGVELNESEAELREEISELETDLSDRDDEITKLEESNEELEEEISRLKLQILPDDSFHYEEKFKTFLEYQDKFSPWEFEKLLTKK